MHGKFTALAILLAAGCTETPSPSPSLSPTPSPADASAPAIELADARAAGDDGDAKTLPPPRAADLRARLGQVFHSLPPPEALATVRDCDRQMAPTDGAPLPIIDHALLEYLGTGLTPISLEGAPLGLATTLDAWRELSTPLFYELRLLDGATPAAQAERGAAIEEELAQILKGERLAVLLPEERSLEPARYRGWLVMFTLETTLPWCWQRLEVDGAEPTIQAAVREAASAATTKVVPDLALRWGPPPRE